MALAPSTFLQVMSGGSDPSNGGGFNVLNSNFPTDGAVTSANTASPVFSSASYSFTSSDNGARIYQKSGTNAILGWFTIASTSGGTATLSAAPGAGTLSTGFLTTATGCGTTSTLSSVTWGIDYSQMTTARISFTDMVIGAVTSSQFTSAANPVGKNFVGNLIQITSGTSFVKQFVEVVSTSGTIASCDKSLGTVSATGGNGGLGGAFATPGQAAAVRTALTTGGMPVQVQAGTYTCTTSTANVSGGVINDTSNPGSVAYSFTYEGYGTVSGDGRQQPPAGTPTISAGSLTSVTLMTLANGHTQSAMNFTLDGNNGASNVGLSSNQGNAYRINAKNCKSFGLQGLGATGFYSCTVTGCSGGNAPMTGTFMFECEVYSNTNSVAALTVSAGGTALRCLSYNNSNVGIQSSGAVAISNCVSYGNGSHGFTDTSGIANAGMWENCIAEANGGFGFQATANNATRWIRNCAAYNNTSGAASNVPYQEKFVTNTTGTFFNNAASGDFSLNNTTNQGALLRGAGYPGVFPAGLTTAYTDIGAAQHQDAGGGGGLLYLAGMEGGMQA